MYENYTHENEELTNRSSYFYWLGKYMGAGGDYYPGKTYWDLFHKLFEMGFYFSNHLDKNRLIDGLRFRDIWYQEELELGHADVTTDFGECTVLEMLIGLSIRIEQDVMSSPDRGDRSRFWFWTMIHNLGFDQFDDKNMTYSALDTVTYKVHSFMDHTYKPNGEGGLFPLRNNIINGHRIDMRKHDIWMQAQYFLTENRQKFSE